MKFTIRQLQEKLEVSYPEAFGLVKILLKYELVTEEKLARTENQKGKTASVYTFKPGFGKELEVKITEVLVK